MGSVFAAVSVLRVQSLHVSCFGKVIEQEVEVNQSSIFSPPLKDSPHAFVIEILTQSQPACQVIAGAHIVAGKYVPSSQTS